MSTSMATHETSVPGVRPKPSVVEVQDEDLRILAEDIRKLRELRDQIVSGRHAFYMASTAAANPLGQNGASSSTLLQRITPKLSQAAQSEKMVESQVMPSSKAALNPLAARLANERKKPLIPTRDHAGPALEGKSREPTTGSYREVKSRRVSGDSHEPRFAQESRSPNRTRGEKDVIRHSTTSQTAVTSLSLSDYDRHREKDRMPFAAERDARHVAPFSKRQRQNSPRRSSSPGRYYSDLEAGYHRPNRFTTQRRSPSPYQQAKTLEHSATAGSLYSNSPSLGYQGRGFTGTSIQISKSDRGGLQNDLTLPLTQIPVHSQHRSSTDAARPAWAASSTGDPFGKETMDYGSQRTAIEGQARETADSKTCCCS